MLGHLGWGELAVLMLIGLFVVGPERLPRVAADAGRGLRRLRVMLRGLTDELKAELGPEMADLDLASLHPKTFVQRHLFGDDDDPEPARAGGSGSGPRLRTGEVPPWDPETT